jgi:hypothetical protein
MAIESIPALLWAHVENRKEYEDECRKLKDTYPYSIYSIEFKPLTWGEVLPWMEEHVGAVHKDWTVGRRGVYFLHQEHLVEFCLTWG